MISTRSQLGPSSERTRGTGAALPPPPLSLPLLSSLLLSLQWVQSLGPPGVPHTVHQGCGQHCGSRTLWPITKAGLQQGRAGDTGVQGLCCTHWARRHQAEAQWAGHCLQAVLAKAAGRQIRGSLDSALQRLNGRRRPLPATPLAFPCLVPISQAGETKGQTPDLHPLLPC